MKWIVSTVLLTLVAAALFFIFADRLNDLAEMNEKAVAAQTKVNQAIASQITEDAKAETAIFNYCTKQSALAQQNATLIQQNNGLAELVKEEAQAIQQLEDKLAEKTAPRT